MSERELLAALGHNSDATEESSDDDHDHDTLDGDNGGEQAAECGLGADDDADVMERMVVAGGTAAPAAEAGVADHADGTDGANDGSDGSDAAAEVGVADHADGADGANSGSAGSGASPVSPTPRRRGKSTPNGRPKGCVPKDKTGQPMLWDAEASSWVDVTGTERKVPGRTKPRSSSKKPAAQAAPVDDDGEGGEGGGGGDDGDDGADGYGGAANQSVIVAQSNGDMHLATEKLERQQLAETHAQELAAAAARRQLNPATPLSAPPAATPPRPDRTTATARPTPRRAPPSRPRRRGARPPGSKPCSPRSSNKTTQRASPTRRTGGQSVDHYQHTRLAAGDGRARLVARAWPTPRPNFSRRLSK